MPEMPKVLIVDDDMGACQVLDGLLMTEHYELSFAHNGRDALLRAALWQPDAILCDVMMPGMDGFEVCRQLRATPMLAEVPIILVTALDDRASRLKGIEVGADEFVVKPFDRMELRARVRTITRLNRYRKLSDERIKLEQAHRELQKAYTETIEGWSRAMDLRDHETEGHSKRVAELSLQLAQLVGIQGDELRIMRLGALLHDIGKLAVPDAVLLKPGKLTTEEWTIMKKHPQFAHDMLAPVQYLKTALDIPYCHHEKWNGSGYPRGLRGEAIPLAARVFAVVDVWDAMTSDRPYRHAISREETLRFIQEQSGEHFDPQVVRAFTQLTCHG